MKLAFFQPLNNIELQSIYTAQLGLGYIISTLKRELNLKDIIVDTDIDRLIFQKPDIVAINAYTETFVKASAAAKKIKKELNIPVIMGGHHITAMPESLPEHVDIAVLGEAEYAFCELMKLYLNNDINNLNINGIAFHNNEEIIVTGKPNFIKELDSLPFADRRILDSGHLPWKYNPYNPMPVTMFTGRGCPFKCSFCINSKIKRKIRFHSVERVIEEIKHIIYIYPYIKSISIMDELFTVDKPRLYEIAKVITEEKIDKKIIFGCQARAENFDEETCLILKSMNVQLISLGFESGVDRILNYLKKGRTKSRDIDKSLEICKKYNIDVTGYFIIGTPIGTYSDLAREYWFIRKNLKFLNSVYVHNIVPFPGTRLWDEAKDNNWIKPEDIYDWKKYSYFKQDSIFFNPNYSHQSFSEARKWFDDFKEHFVLNQVAQAKYMEMEDYKKQIYKELPHLASEYIKGRVLILDSSSARIPDEYFDIIIFEYILSRTKEPEKLIEKAFKHLIPEGQLIAIEHNAAYINNILSLISDKKLVSADLMHLFNASRLMNLFAAYGDRLCFGGRGVLSHQERTIVNIFKKYFPLNNVNMHSLIINVNCKIPNS